MTEEKIPEAISEHVLEIMGKKLRVYLLDDGRTIVNADDVADFFEIKEGDEEF